MIGVLANRPAGEPGGIHGINVGIENDPVEMPDHYGECGQNGFV